jgi:hypothetical protein
MCSVSTPTPCADFSDDPRSRELGGGVAANGCSRQERCTSLLPHTAASRGGLLQDCLGALGRETAMVREQRKPAQRQPEGRTGGSQG